MKRLILFITTILSLQASAQILNGPQGYGKQEYRYRALNFLGLPVQDTVCDLIVNGTNGTCEGAVVYKPEDSTLYVRTASHWRPLATGGDLVNSLNGLSGALSLAAGTSGTDFNINPSGGNITLNIPSASATARGLVTTGFQTFAGSKVFSNNISIQSVPAMGSAASRYMVLNGDVVNSRTPAQVLSDIAGAPATESAGYINNQSATARVENFHMQGAGYTQTNFSVYKAGSESYNGYFNLWPTTAATRGASLQLTAGAIPGLAMWVHDGTNWVERMRINSFGQVCIGLTFHPSNLKLAVGGGARIDSLVTSQVNVASLYTAVRPILADADVSITSLDHTILLETPNTGTTQNITLPSPSPGANQGRILVFIENSSDTWNLNYTVINPGGPAFTVLPANTTTILQVVNGQWYKIN